MAVADATRLKAPEAENAKLKRMLAEQMMMDVATLKDMLGKTSKDEPCRAIDGVDGATTTIATARIRASTG